MGSAVLQKASEINWKFWYIAVINVNLYCDEGEKLSFLGIDLFSKEMQQNLTIWQLLHE